MSAYLTSDEIAGLGTAIATLETDRKNSESTFLGTLNPKTYAYEGAGIREARGIAGRLNSTTPGPFGTAADWDTYRQLVIRVGKIVGG